MVTSPAYPGEQNGDEKAYAGKVYGFVGPKVEAFYPHSNGFTYRIFFYQLEDGRGWIHDFQRGNPGVRTLEALYTYHRGRYAWREAMPEAQLLPTKVRVRVVPEAKLQLEVEARSQEAGPKSCCVCCKDFGVGFLGLVLGGISAIMLFVSFFTAFSKNDFNAPTSAPTLIFLSAHLGLGFPAILIIVIHRYHAKKSQHCENKCGRVCASVSILLWIITVVFVSNLSKCTDSRG